MSQTPLFRVVISRRTSLASCSFSSRPLPPQRTMPTLPSLPSIPIPPLVSTIFAKFPLITYPVDPSESTPAPTTPTLWLLGPPPSITKGESLDPASRQAQAWARFSRLETETFWLASPVGAPGGTLPSLHLADGSLLSTEEVGAGIAGAVGSTSSTKKQQDAKATAASASVTATAQDPTHQAYSSLLQTTLLPAVLAALYLTPPTTTSTTTLHITPPTSLPYLSSLAASLQSYSVRRARIAEIKRLRGGKVSSRQTLDLEEVERDALEALGALEVKRRKDEGESRWFGGASAATELDAWLYALLSIVLVLPYSSGGLLKEKLERCPALLAWVKELRP